MQKRFTSLSFIIGFFFLLVALILIGGHFLSAQLSAPLNLYAGIAFFVFGLCMMSIRPVKED